MAAEILVSLVASIIAELQVKINSVTYWTDATCVLHCIKSPQLKLLLFVANQLKNIHDIVNPWRWQYVPMDKNPANVGLLGLARGNGMV